MQVEYRDRAAYLSETSTLVVADLHLGRLSASQVDAPLDEYDHVLDRLRSHLDALDPETLVVAGDLLHVHGSVPGRTAAVVDTLVSDSTDRGVDPVFVRGNHDTLLDSLDLEQPGLRTVDEYRVSDDVVVCHGHEEPSADASTYVIGHEHPAIRVEGARHACFLRGDEAYQGADVVVLPAFSYSARGTLVNGLGAGMSPLVADLGCFRPVVVGEEAYEFPPLESLSGFL